MFKVIISYQTWTPMVLLMHDWLAHSQKENDNNLIRKEKKKHALAAVMCQLL